MLLNSWKVGDGKLESVTLTPVISCFTFVEFITDRTSEEGNAIGSVRPSIRTSLSTLIFRTKRPLTFIFRMCVDHDHSL